MPQNWNFRLPRSHRFWPKFDFTVMAWNHGGDPLGSILGPMGSHWVQKMGQNRKKWPCPKIRFFDYPAVIYFGQNSTLRFWRQITVGTLLSPSWGQWGPIGSKKWVKTVKNFMPQNSNFRLPRGHRFLPKFDFTVKAPNHGGDPLGSILGPMGSHWVQKIGQNRKKLPCPKIRIFDYPALIDFDQNSTLLFWRQITDGIPYGPSWGQWGPIGSKKGSKP